MKRAFWLVVVLQVAICLGFSGCSSTVRPRPVVDSVASFDGGEQNSGVLRFAPGGAVITERARARYNALVRVYGERFLPVLKEDDGVKVHTEGTPGSTSAKATADRQGTRPTAGGASALAGEWFMDNEHLVKFATMNRWRKEEVGK